MIPAPLPGYRELHAAPTLTQGQADDLKQDDGEHRVWLSRVDRADGATFDRGAAIEEYTAAGKWELVAEYDAVAVDVPIRCAYCERTAAGRHTLTGPAPKWAAVACGACGADLHLLASTVPVRWAPRD